MASPQDMAASMKANLKEKTGKTLAQWLKITKAAKLEKHGQIVKFLKTEHGMTHGFANLVAHETLGGIPSAASGGNELVESQYSGAKSELRPIYEALVAAVKKLGKDVDVSPKKSYVSLRRNKQFAIIQPSTKTRVDLGLNLKGTKLSKRLEAAGSFNSMVTHRVRVTDKKEVDADVKKWLKAAYESA